MTSHSCCITSYICHMTYVLITTPLCRLASQLLEIVDFKTLTKKSSLQKVQDYLDSSLLFAGKLNIEVFRKLSRALTECTMWTSLVSLFHHSLRLLPDAPRSVVCKPLELLIKRVSVCGKVTEILEKLSDEQKATLSCEVCSNIL